MTTTRLSSKLVVGRHNDVEAYYSHWCAGCGHAHTFHVGGNRPSWSFDGNAELPTFAPSMREFIRNGDGSEGPSICHYQLTAGVMNYCADCQHPLAGKSFPLDDIPSDYCFGDVAMKDLTS